MDTAPTDNRVAWFAQRLWLSVVCMSFWEWGILSLVLGGLGIWLYGQRDTVPRNPADRVTQDTFLDELSDRLPDGKSPVRDVVIYPWHDGVRLVTYKLATPNGNAIEYSNHFLYEKSAQGSPPEQLGAIAASAGVASRAVHWVGPPIRLIILWGGGTVIVVGLLWPLILHRLSKQGYGPKLPQPAESGPQIPAPVEFAPEIPEPVAPQTTEAPPAPAASTPPPVQLSSEPMPETAPPPAEEDKDYRGEYYPVAHPRHESKGFTLVELLVAIGIIGILMSLLFPALSGARRAAEQLQCASNLRNIGLGIVFYLDQNQGVYPAAYLYVGEQITDGVETPPNSSDGYMHWSTYLYGSSIVPQAEAFQCPALDRGGIPPDDTTPDNLDPGQASGTPGVVDQQVARLAYTLNEAICPRNKFVLGFQGALRTYQYVSQGQVSDPSGTILGTEWGPTGARISGSSGTFETVSHRPVTGFIGTDGTQDMFLLSPSTPFRRVTVADLDPDPASSSDSTTRLDWVGRNHGQLRGYPDKRRSNFLYVDGHIETKSIYETLSPFQWGRQFYTLNPHDDLDEAQNP